MDLPTRIGQMLMAGVDGVSFNPDVVEVVVERRVGGVILLSRNASAPAGLASFTNSMQELALATTGIGLLVAVDQEGGSVQRLREGFTDLPSAATLGSDDEAKRTESLAQLTGEELLRAGVNMNLAPVLDVATDGGPIGDRSYSTDAGVVSEHGLAVIQGLRSAGIIAVAKHFPGHGSATADSHFEAATVASDDETLRSRDLLPFLRAMNVGLEAVMLAHVSYPALDNSGVPATVSPIIVGGLLRSELRFEGVVMTDDMGMQGVLGHRGIEEAAVAAVLAGADVVLCVRAYLPGACTPELFERMHSALLLAVEDGRISEDRINESVGRILALKQRHGLAVAPRP